MIFLRSVLAATLLVQLSTAASSSSKSSSPTPSSCPSRTVNYITHGLPQQCLASSRTAANNTTSNGFSLDGDTTASTSQDVSTSGPPTTTPGFTSVESVEQETVSSSSAWPLPVTVAENDSTQTIATHDKLSTSSEPKTSASLSPAEAYTSEEDSMLEDANFLSFEDWKRQNLVKAGQSEHIGAGRQNEHREIGKRNIPASQQGLDALGDDAEIDLDFIGFVSDRPDLAPPTQPVRAPQSDSHLDLEVEPAISNIPRSKDAGTTCKERYNYASFDCAATILKTNPKTKGEKYILLENKDSYMLNECSADNKFLIMELCNDILIDTIVLANFEFFSSIFRTFRVSVSDKYPVKSDKWITLGTFEARNSREVQAFLVENPMIWARYVRIEFLTHYGSEFYCPLSLVRVHGTTMLEEYKHDIASAVSERDNDGDENVAGSTEAVEPEETLVPEAIAQVLVEEKSRSEEAERATQSSDAPTVFMMSNSTNQAVPTLQEVLAVQFLSNTTSRNQQPADLFTLSKHALCSISAPDNRAGEKVMSSVKTNASATERPSMKPIADLGSLESVKANATTSTLTQSQNLTSPSSSTRLTTSTAAANTSTSVTLNSTFTSVKAGDSTSSEKSRLFSSTTQPQAASPTLQESFFKSVQKRLQMLESNSSLSLQYIEEQSRALRDAFARVEQKQLIKTSTFLDYLNTTVLNELRDFRQQYDQLWQSTVIELDTQREQYQRETMATNSRLSILADELIFQKRMSILQMVLILVCLGLVLFSRGPMHNYMDTPIVQSMLARSPSNRWMSASGLQTPSTSPPQTRPSSSHHTKPVNGALKRHSRERSDESMSSVAHHMEEYSPLTPISTDVPSYAELPLKHDRPESPIYDPGEIERPSTSPPVLVE